MTRTFLTAAALAILATSSSQATEPAFRELQLTATFAAVRSPAGIETYVGDGRGFGADLGMAVTSRLSAGIHYGLAELERKTEGVGVYDDRPATGDWWRHEGGAFVEYRLSTRRLAPMVGCGIGVHAMHINYSAPVDGAVGAGMYGVGFDLMAGVQYRGTSHLGAVARVGTGHSQRIADGWFTQAQMGVRLFF